MSRPKTTLQPLLLHCWLFTEIACLVWPLSPSQRRSVNIKMPESTKRVWVNKRQEGGGRRDKQQQCVNRVQPPGPLLERVVRDPRWKCAVSHKWPGRARRECIHYVTWQLAFLTLAPHPPSDLCRISLMCVYAESLTQREEEQEAGRSEPEHGCPVSHGVTQCYPGCHTVLPASHCHTQCYVTEY